jgi:hypothetical protein
MKTKAQDNQTRRKQISLFLKTSYISALRHTRRNPHRRLSPRQLRDRTPARAQVCLQAQLLREIRRSLHLLLLLVHLNNAPQRLHIIAATALPRKFCRWRDAELCSADGRVEDLQGDADDG